MEVVCYGVTSVTQLAAGGGGNTPKGTLTTGLAGCIHGAPQAAAPAPGSSMKPNVSAPSTIGLAAVTTFGWSGDRSVQFGPASCRTTPFSATCLVCRGALEVPSGLGVTRQ